MSEHLTTSTRDMTHLAIAAAWSHLGLSYVISNGIDIASGKVRGRDLDVLVDRHDYHQIIKAAKSRLESANFHVGTHWKSHTAWMFAFGPQNEVFEIDFFRYQQWRYFRFISSPKELTDVVSLGGLQFSPFAWLVKNILIQLLARNFDKVESKISQLAEVVLLYPSVLHDTSRLLGPRVALQLEQLCHNPTRDALKNFSSLLRATCFSLTIRKPRRLTSTISSVIRWGQKLLEHQVICRHMCPSLALVGVDGSGKSTTIKALQQALPEAFPLWRVVLRHWRPGLLPLLSSFSSKPQSIKPGEPVIPRSEAGKLGFLRSLYYSLDFIIGYFIKDRPVKTNIEALVYDRHFGDMVVDPVRFGISGKRFLLAMNPFVPKPDILVLLLATPELARARKGEIPDEKVAQLNDEWLRLGPRFGREFHVVDASLPPPEISRKVCKIYLDCLRKNFVPRK
jgi:thymidylate kinase